MASDAEIERFFYLVQVDGLTSRKAMATLKAEGFPDRGLQFWAKERRKAIAEARNLTAELKRNTGPDGEIYGFRGNC